jgi:hypothetical protein
MDIVEILKWVMAFLLVVGWGVSFAANCMPTNWDIITGAVLGILYGLPAIAKVGKALSKD